MPRKRGGRGARAPQRTKHLQKPGDLPKPGQGTKDVQKPGDLPKPGQGTKDVQKPGDLPKPGQGTKDVQKPEDLPKPGQGTKDVQKPEDLPKPGQGTKDLQKPGDLPKPGQGTKDVQKPGDQLKPRQESTKNVQKQGDKPKPGQGTKDVQKPGDLPKPGQGTTNVQKQGDQPKLGQGTKDVQKPGDLPKPGQGTKNVQKQGDQPKPGQETTNSRIQLEKPELGRHGSLMQHLKKRLTPTFTTNVTSAANCLMDDVPLDQWFSTDTRLDLGLRHEIRILKRQALFAMREKRTLKAVAAQSSKATDEEDNSCQGPKISPMSPDEYPDLFPPAASPPDQNIFHRSSNSNRNIMESLDQIMTLVDLLSKFSNTKETPIAEEKTSDGTEALSESTEFSKLKPADFRIVNSKFWRMMGSKYDVSIEVIDSKINLIQPLLNYLLKGNAPESFNMADSLKMLARAIIVKHVVSIKHLDATLFSQGAFASTLRDCYALIQEARRTSLNLKPDSKTDSANEVVQKSIKGLPQKERDLNNVREVRNCQRPGQDSVSEVRNCQRPGQDSVSEVRNCQRPGQDSVSEVGNCQRPGQDSVSNTAPRRGVPESETNTTTLGFQSFIGDTSVRPKTVQEEKNNKEGRTRKQKNEEHQKRTTSMRPSDSSAQYKQTTSMRPSDSSAQYKQTTSTRPSDSSAQKKQTASMRPSDSSSQNKQTTPMRPSDSSAQNKQTSQEISEASESRKDQDGTETNYPKYISGKGQAGTTKPIDRSTVVQMSDLEYFYQELGAIMREAKSEGDFHYLNILDSLEQQFQMADIIYLIFVVSCELRHAFKVHELPTTAKFDCSLTGAPSQCSVMQSEPELNQTSTLTCETTGFELRQVGADTSRAASKSEDGDKDEEEAGAAETGTAEAGTTESGAAETGTAETGTAEAGTVETGTAEAGTAEAGTTEDGTAGTRAGPHATAVSTTNEENQTTSRVTKISSVGVTWQSKIRERCRTKAMETFIPRELGLKPIELCNGCGNNYRWPHLLHCFHRFCFPCLVKLYDAARQCFKCPLCELLTIVDTPWVGPRSLKIDTITAKQMFEANLSPFCCTRCCSVDNAIKFCIACLQYLCTRCCHLHGVTASTAGHVLQNSDTKVGATPDGELTYMCPLNPGNIISQFCVTCRKAVCNVCKHDHVSHRLQGMEDAGAVAKERFKTIDDGITEMQNGFQMRLMNLNQSKQRLDSLHRSERRRVSDVSNELLHHIDAMRNEAIANLDQTVDNINSQSVFVKADQELGHQKLQTFVDFTSRYLAYGSKDVLKVFPLIRDNYKELYQNFSNNIMLQDGFNSEIKFDPKYPEVTNSINETFSSVRSEFDCFLAHMLDSPLVRERHHVEPYKPPSYSLDYRCKSVTASGESRERQETILGADLSMSDGDLDQFFRVTLPYSRAFGRYGRGQYEFAEPSGVLYLHDFSLAVCDTRNHRIVVYHEDGTYQRTIGQPRRIPDLPETAEEIDRTFQRTSGKLYFPYRLAQCPVSYNIVVVERPPSPGVQIFTFEGQFVRCFGNSYLQNPRGVAVDERGLILVLESKTMNFFIFTPEGDLINKSVLGTLEFPNDVVARNGTIYISDNRHHSVKCFNYSLNFKESIGNESLTYYPISVGFNHNGHLVVTDNHNTFNITVFDKFGKFLHGFKSRVKHANCYNVALHPTRAELVVTTKECQVLVFQYGESELEGFEHP